MSTGYRTKVNGRDVAEMSAREQADLARRSAAKLAEMFAAGQPPQIKTTSTFLADGKLGGAQFSDATREQYLAPAREAGVSTDGKFYEGRVARFPGDPQAWVEGPDDTRRVLEERGWGCSGDIKVAGRVEGPPKDVPLADDIVESLVEGRLVEQYGDDFTEIKGKVVEETRQAVIQDHSPPAHLS